MAGRRAKPQRDVDLEREVVVDSRGRRIDQAYVDEVVAHVHDVLRGRPSLTGRSERSPSISFRLTPELRRRAEAAAKAEGRRVSDIAREALERYLAS